MPAYAIVLTTLSDLGWVEEYVRDVGPVIERFGGRVLTRAPVTEVLEGDHRPHGAVILEFASRTDALRLYESEEYAPLKALRQGGSSSEMFVVGD